MIGFLRGLISSVAILTVGFYLAPTLIISPLLLSMLLMSCFVFALFGVLIALVVNTHQGMSSFSTLVILPMTFLCGTFFSLSQLPDIARVLLYLLPLTHSAELLRATVLGQPFPWLPLFGLLIFGVVFFVTCIVALKKSSV